MKEKETAYRKPDLIQNRPTGQCHLDNDIGQKAKETDYISFMIISLCVLDNKAKPSFTAADRVNNLKTAETAYKDLKEKLAYDPEYLLPEPSSPLMLARTYKEEVARPLVKKLKSIIKSLFVQYHKVRDNLIRVTGERDKLLQKNNRLSDENGSPTRENAILKEQNKGFRRLQKYFGPQKLEEMLNQTKAPRQREHQEKQANIA